MKNVGANEAACVLTCPIIMRTDILLAIALTISSFAQARIVFFSRSYPTLMSLSDRNVIPPPMPPSPPPGITPRGIQIIISLAMDGKPLPGSVSMRELARLSSEGFTKNAELPPEVNTLVDQLLSGSPSQIQSLKLGAKYALAVSEALLKAVNAHRTTSISSGSTENLAFNDPLNPFSWRNSSSKEQQERLQMGPLVAENSNTFTSNSTRLASLDEKTLEFTYAIQFAAMGLLNKDGYIFITWAAANAIRCSNALNNSVIDFMQYLSATPQSSERDAQYALLTSYIRNPLLRRIQVWLSELGVAISGKGSQRGG